MTYLCLTVVGSAVQGLEVSDYTTCPAPSFIGLPVSDVSAYTASSLKTLFDSYFAFDPELAQLLTTSYLVFFITGFGVGIVLKWMRRV